MTAQSELEIKGNFLTHPLAELLAEIATARLDGSLRLSEKQRKCVVYFREGRVVFAVSNARSSRLFDVLLRTDKLGRDDLARIPEFQNDFELTAYLKETGLLTLSDCDRLFNEQIEAILVDALTWESGEWAFDHLARAREGLECNIDVPRLLVGCGRSMPLDKILSRFRSLDETFTRSEVPESAFHLTADEAALLSHISAGTVTVSGLLAGLAISESAALQALYILWLGGLLSRDGWQAAFSAASVAFMRTARIELKREAKVAVAANVTVNNPAVVTMGADHEVGSDEAAAEPENTLSLEDYLERVESAETFYDILGVESNAATDELKTAYFALARQFHPDRYHADGGETLKRVQDAFSELAQAHETLKNPTSREMYDYKMRKEIGEREKARKAGETGNGHASLQLAQATESFERGFTVLMDGDPEAATPFLARAVHWAPGNARFHAYYGKALSADEKQRHKAEAEMQAAIKLEPNNKTFRLLLAEFFIQYNLPKRAEGELRRLLALHPDNHDARDLLDSLKAK